MNDRKPVLEIAEQKGSLISNFALIEFKMNEFIASAYIQDKERAMTFSEEVLEHKFFGFELKKAVLYSTLQRTSPEHYKKFPKSKLERIQQIRNIVAHGVVAAPSQEDVKHKERFQLRHGGKDYNAVEIIKEYYDNSKVVLGAVLDLPGVYEEQFKDE